MPNTPPPLEIIGALSPGRVADLATVEAALAGESQTLGHGDTFTGRPVTRIMATPDGVLKWSLEPFQDPEAARACATAKLMEERRLRVHHPAKTWCLLHHDGGTQICNYTPRLLPLHTGLAQLRQDQRLPALEATLSRYVQAAAQGVRLDEGLSNFGLSQDGKVFYLDDDLYPWDAFLGLGVGLGVWWRQLDNLQAAQAASLGQFLRQQLEPHWPDGEAVAKLRQHLRSMLCVTEGQQARRDGFLVGLAAPPGTRVASEVAVAAPTQDSPPQKLALLADIHANLPALKVVLAALPSLGVSQGIVLGDVVGYGPYPGECIALLQAHPELQVIKGNHDNALAGGIPEVGFSRQARWALEWSQSQLNEAQRQWLGQLPLYVEETDFLAVHGAPLDRSYFNAYVYRMTYEDNLDYMASHNIQVCFHGHTHVQGAYYRRGVVQGFISDSPLVLAHHDQVLICPGSVGQPRSAVPGAEFAVLDRDAGAVCFYRLAYDLEGTVAAMAEAGFPEALMERLREGK